MLHKKSIVHVAGHTAYIALYGLLIIFFILFYNWANLEILLYLGWITLAFGIVFYCGQANRARKDVHWKNFEV